MLTRRESGIESGLRQQMRPEEGTHNVCRLSTGPPGSAQFGTFRGSVLELVDQFILFLLTQWRATAFLSVLVDET